MQGCSGVGSSPLCSCATGRVGDLQIELSASGGGHGSVRRRLGWRALCSRVSSVVTVCRVLGKSGARAPRSVHRGERGSSSSRRACPLFCSVLVLRLLLLVLIVLRLLMKPGAAQTVLSLHLLRRLFSSRECGMHATATHVVCLAQIAETRLRPPAHHHPGCASRSYSMLAHRCRRVHVGDQHGWQHGHAEFCAALHLLATVRVIHAFGIYIDCR